MRKRKIKIKGSSWTVKFHKDLRQDDGTECTGLTDVDNRIIYIDQDTAPENIEWVFWHEYCHALLWESGVTKNNGGINELAEEIICDGFADTMTSKKPFRFKRNKK